MKKIVSLFMCMVLTFGVFGIGLTQSVTAEAATDVDFEAYMDKQGFPENYKPYLRQLHELYPNWEFKAFDTRMKWSEAVKAERRDHTQQLISNTAQDSFKCKCSSCYKNGKYVIQEPPDFVSASEEAVAYYMNPLNFLNDKYIYQFETTSYDSSQTEAGIETILKGTWMYQSNISYKDASGKTQTIDETYASVILEAAKDSGMSAYYLASKIVQEVGGSKPTAGGVSGTNSKYPGIYNYYSIGANDGATDGLAWASSGLSTSKSTTLYKNVTAGSRDLGMIAAKNSVTIRASASETASAVGTLTDGLYVYLDGETGDWYQVSYTLGGQDYAGYVQKKYVEALTATSASGTVASLPSGTSLTYKGVSGNYYYVSATLSGKTYTGYVVRSAVDASSGRPWYTPERSIYYGAQWIAKSFGKDQFTGYLQKYNVNPDSDTPHSHEYMANVSAAATEAYNIYETYRDGNMISAAKVFFIPVFDGTPDATDGPHSVNETPYSAYGRVQTETVDLNVREGPSTSYDRLTKLKSGTIVKITAKVGNGWYRISFTQNGKDYDGYVSGEYIVIVSMDEVEESDTRAQVMVSAPLKTSASNNSATKVTLSKGDQAYVNGESGSWYKISLMKDGLPYAGYIEKQFVKIISGDAKPIGMVVANTANVLSSASTSSSVKTTLNRNQYAYIDGESGSFYLVSFTKGSSWYYGYMKKDYLRDYDLPRNYTVTKSDRLAQIMVSEIIVRDEANTGSAPVTVVPKNSYLYINEDLNNGWYKVSLTQTANATPYEGYVRKQYVKIYSGDPKPLGVVVANTVNVLSSANTNSSVKTTLNRNQYAYIDGESGNFYTVSFTKGSSWYYGYIKKDYLRDYDLPRDYEVEESERTAQVMVSEVIVRDEANTGSAPVTVIPNGETMYVNEELDGWYKVSLEQTDAKLPYEGYVRKQYVKITSGEPKPLGIIVADTADVLSSESTSASTKTTLNRNQYVYIDGESDSFYLVSFTKGNSWYYGYMLKTDVKL